MIINTLSCLSKGQSEISKKLSKRPAVVILKYLGEKYKYTIAYTSDYLLMGRVGPVEARSRADREILNRSNVNFSGLKK